ncbi:hypothetical protein NQ317_016470 [Molorchus minor]|uniref:Tyr recombinase domain-containing protein n=1 Tax=Molorchus minor TaxID=1323400 RepID=A0ABQ9JP23_9CUCU|nr:hypothetical protein NQ317_016470 [Molorchus minor]
MIYSDNASISILYQKDLLNYRNLSSATPWAKPKCVKVNTHKNNYPAPTGIGLHSVHLFIKKHVNAISSAQMKLVITHVDIRRSLSFSDYSHVEQGQADWMSFRNNIYSGTEVVLLIPKQYEAFQKWCRVQNVQKPTENALLVYFDEKSKVVCSLTLWAHYSMLKSVINIRENVDISKFPKLLAFFEEKKMRDLNQKKSNVLTIEQVDQFLREAPDDKYLFMKVSCSYCGRCAGACRGKELVDLEVNDVRDMGDFFLITVRITKNKVDRNFVIKNSENSIDIVKIFRKECTKRPVGKNMFGIFPWKIAAFLKLENATSYTGHCFRRTSTSLLADSGGTIDVLKRHGGWKSSNVVEGYVESSIKNKQNISDKIFEQVADLSSMDVRSSSSLSPPVSAALSEQTSVQYEYDVSGMNQKRAVKSREFKKFVLENKNASMYGAFNENATVNTSCSASSTAVWTNTTTPSMYASASGHLSLPYTTFNPGPSTSSVYSQPSMFQFAPYPTMHVPFDYPQFFCCNDKQDILPLSVMIFFRNIHGVGGSLNRHIIVVHAQRFIYCTANFKRLIYYTSGFGDMTSDVSKIFNN